MWFILEFQTTSYNLFNTVYWYKFIYLNIENGKDNRVLDQKVLWVK